VLLGVAAVQALAGRRLPFAVEVLGFSEEEGVRFRTPYLGSLAVSGRFNPDLLKITDATGISLADALRNFGLDPEQISTTAYSPDRVLGYLETHIEQGPILADLNLAVGVVQGIVGQTRLWLSFQGKAGHAGTLPMERRQDALAAAAEFVQEVERLALATAGMRGTVGQISVTPGAVNVVPGVARLSVDIRHPVDSVLTDAVTTLLGKGQGIAVKRGVGFLVEQKDHHDSFPADSSLTDLLEVTIRDLKHPCYRMVSGAGHDAAVMAALTPWTMLFIRSPNGISHHPEEAVLPDDITIALDIMVNFLFRLAGVAK
jgi:allantoate deiminase